MQSGSSQNFSGHSSAASKYTSSAVEIPSKITFPSIFVAPYFSRSQAHTYTTASAKNPTVQAMKTMSNMALAPPQPPGVPGCP
jgi:hypothetical protein